MSTNDQIDMRKLSQRELLILLHSRVENIEKKMEKDEDLSVRVNTLETRNKVISGLWAAGSVLVTLIINALDKFK